MGTIKTVGIVIFASRRFVVRSEKRLSRRILAPSDEGHKRPRGNTTPCPRILASDRARGRRKDPEVRCACTGRAREGTCARSAREKGSASTGGIDASARSAGARASASTGGSDTSARSAGALRSASTGGSEADARSAGARASASTGGSNTTARSAGAGASASTGGCEADARSAFALRRSASAPLRPRLRLRSKSRRNPRTSTTRAKRTTRFYDVTSTVRRDAL